MQAAIERVLVKYRAATVREPYVVVGSSMGALQFGHVRVSSSVGH